MIGYTFHAEVASQCFDEALPLLGTHWAEIAHFKDIPLNPDWDIYLKAEAGGMLRAFSIRLEATKELVGYVVFFVRPNAHYRDSLQAVQDILYVHPDHRKGFLALEFLDFCDDELRAQGVQCVYHHVKDAHQALGVVLKRLSYEQVETVWVRRLDQ